MTDTGFIGTGTIGAPMALRMLEAGHRLRVHDVLREVTRELEARGAVHAPTVREIAQTCDVVCLSLPGPPQIEEVLLGAGGLLAYARPAAVIVDLSTNSLALNRRIAAAAAARGVHYLDAPVSGGRAGAAAGRLSVMVGGDRAAFEAVRGRLECFAKHVFYLGASGFGTLAKLVNNQIFLAASVLVQEGFVFGTKAGIEPDALLEVLKASSAGPLLAHAPLMLSREFSRDVFALAIAAKDVAVALESATALGVDAPVTTAAHAVYRRALDAGFGAEDFYATVKVLERAAGVAVPALKGGR
ncbi:MAG: NAD(P)-dependent oxidoreductase [Gammaproteobacteria bacterium]